MSDRPLSENNTRLVDAVRQIKIASAERTDVVVDMKEADRARLDLLAQHMQPVFDDVPLDDERFDFALSSGLQPRLWIDATAHTMMGRDRRTYRFVRDTRMGRIILAESTAIEPIAEAITTYIAERLHERELAFAGEEMVTYRQGVSQRPVVEAERLEDELAADNSTLARHEGASDDAPGSVDHKVPAADATPATGAAQTTPTAPARYGRQSVTSVGAMGWVLVAVLMAGAIAVLIFRDMLI